MRHLLLLLFSGFLFLSGLAAQQVWPGDVNNNGQVNGVDLLFWGIANGSNGPARAGGSPNWEAQTAPANWSQFFSNGLNYYYADCNGDGQINEDDFDEAIDDNFGLTHGTLLAEGYANAASGSAAPRLVLTPDMEVVEEGAIVNISLAFADEQQPLPNFYGLALYISYTTGLLEGNDGPDFDLVEDEWLDAADGAVLDLFVDDDGLGTADLAVTRTNQITVATQPSAIGNFSIVIEDIIVGLSVDTFELVIDSILFIGDLMQTIAVVPDTATIIVAKDASTLSTSTSAGENQPAEVQNNIPVRLYPNPARRILYLDTPSPVEHVELMDQLGRKYMLPSSRITAGTYELRLPLQLPAGIYWLKGRGPSGNFYRKLLLSP